MKEFFCSLIVYEVPVIDEGEKRFIFYTKKNTIFAE